MLHNPKTKELTNMLPLLLLSCFSRVRLCVTPQMAAHQALPSLGFSRQEHWSGLRPCWTKAGKAAHSQAAQGGTGVSGWRPFAGSCSGSSVLPEAPEAGHLDCAARGLRRPNARGPGTASSIEGKPAWCEDHVL